jgi:hypothetical protein
MSTKYIHFVPLLLATLFATSSSAFEALSDEELNSIAAGSTNVDYESMESLTRIPFRYVGRRGEVDGEVIVIPMSSYSQASQLQLMDNAQSNLQSLININAVNSPVQILLNLNINVNSSIGNINQLNRLLSQTAH